MPCVSKTCSDVPRGTPWARVIFPKCKCSSVLLTCEKSCWESVHSQWHVSVAPNTIGTIVQISSPLPTVKQRLQGNGRITTAYVGIYEKYMESLNTHNNLMCFGHLVSKICIWCAPVQHRFFGYNMYPFLSFGEYFPDQISFSPLSFNSCLASLWPLRCAARGFKNWSMFGFLFEQMLDPKWTPRKAQHLPKR